MLVTKGFYLPNETPNPRRNCENSRFSTALTGMKSCTVDRGYASAQGRHETGGVLSLFSSLSFDISIKNSMQR